MKHGQSQGERTDIKKPGLAISHTGFSLSLARQDAYLILASL